MVRIIKNEVEEYYLENENKNISLKKVSKNLGIKFRRAVFLAKNSNRIKLVDPLEVGCNKKFMHLYRLDMD
tara:strand:- start:1942 stop:2154 length:213 start_codon:yes stop_codon:yes gene_type:complete